MKQVLVGIMGNIDDDTFRWIVGGLIGILSSIGGFWLSNLTNRIDSVTTEISKRSERISVLETNVDGVSKRLDRIEQKIDYLIQGKAK